MFFPLFRNFPGKCLQHLRIHSDYGQRSLHIVTDICYKIPAQSLCLVKLLFRQLQRICQLSGFQRAFPQTSAFERS